MILPCFHWAFSTEVPPVPIITPYPSPSSKTQRELHWPPEFSPRRGTTPTAIPEPSLPTEPSLQPPERSEISSWLWMRLLVLQCGRIGCVCFCHIRYSNHLFWFYNFEPQMIRLRHLLIAKKSPTTCDLATHLLFDLPPFLRNGFLQSSLQFTQQSSDCNCLFGTGYSGYSSLKEKWSQAQKSAANFNKKLALQDLEALQGESRRQGCQIRMGYHLCLYVYNICVHHMYVQIQWPLCHPKT